MAAQKFLFLTILLVFICDLKAFRTFYINGIETLLAQQGEHVKIQCRTETPMAYCGFKHPSGKIYSFSGTALDNGQCTVKVKATSSDNGQWRCHIGRKDSIGVEDTQTLELRIVGKLAAVIKNVTTIHGKPVTLHCATSKNMLPLRYCRFEPPSGKAFNIHPKVNASNPILGRYYYPYNMSLDRGDCAVTIKKAEYEDVGLWTCGAGLDDSEEHIDTVIVDVEGFYRMSIASATGITVGAIGVAAIIGVLGFVVWNKRRLLGTGPNAQIEEIDLPERSPSRSRQATPQASPRLERHIPIIIVQSPSDHGSSPLT